MGLTLTDNVTQLIAATLGTVGVVVVAWWQFGRTTRAAEKATHTLGDLSDDDDLTVVQMLQTLLAGQTRQDARIAAHDALHAAHDRRAERQARVLSSHEARLTDAERRIATLEGGDQ